MTALVVTHDLMLLDPGFDRVYAVRRGELAATGTPAEVLRGEVLADIYGDEHVRAQQAFGRTFVWSEL
jgi:iron complex transport system ATP-binding protein